jgi:hypothetical protein
MSAAKMKPSAYRSMALAKEGKTKSQNGELRRWISEKWRNLTPIMLGETGFYECGEQSKSQKKAGLPSVCRPTVKVNEKTPKLAQNYTKAQIKKAVAEKQKGKVINWSKL